MRWMVAVVVGNEKQCKTAEVEESCVKRLRFRLSEMRDGKTWTRVLPQLYPERSASRKIRYGLYQTDFNYLGTYTLCYLFCEESHLLTAAAAPVEMQNTQPQISNREASLVRQLES